MLKLGQALGGDKLHLAASSWPAQQPEVRGRHRLIRFKGRGTFSATVESFSLFFFSVIAFWFFGRMGGGGGRMSHGVLELVHQVFHGTVEDIEVGKTSRDRLYRIRCALQLGWDVPPYTNSPQ